MTNRRAICLLTLLALCALSAGAPSTRTDPPSEYEVKAAFLYHFVSFIEWPHQVFHYDDSPITIGVLGEDPFGPALTKVVTGRMAKGRLFEIRHFKSVDEIGVCHVLFISSSEQARLSAILAALKLKWAGEGGGFAGAHAFPLDVPTRCCGQASDCRCLLTVLPKPLDYVDVESNCR